ncbi:MAG: TOBE domain-containing protein, partial [Martelella sp.]
AIEAEVTLIEALGPETVVHANTDGEQKLVAVFGGGAVDPEATHVSLRFDPERVHLFNSDEQRVN